MSQAPSLSERILLRPASQEDFLTLATLEADTFDADDFSVVAFGPERHSPHK